MNRGITLAGFVVLAAALILREFSALRARRKHRVRRPLTFGELVAAGVRLSQIRWPLLVGWLWLGWHLFARVDWR
jgi:Family of unknown function (DUF6186)